MRLISTAQAAGETVAPKGAGIAELAMLAVFVLIFYFLMWRPQSKRAKEHRNLVHSLQKGDEISTAGGIVGKIIKVADNFLLLSIAEGVEIKLQKQSVASILPKGTLKTLS